MKVTWYSAFSNTAVLKVLCLKVKGRALFVIKHLPWEHTLQLGQDLFRYTRDSFNYK